MSENYKFDKIKTPQTVPEWKEYLTTTMESYLTNYTDEIPEEMVSSADSTREGNPYKVRTNWFSAVRLILLLASERELFPEEFNQEWKDFFNGWSSRRMGKLTTETRTTKEEIDTANNLLERAKEFINQ